MTATALDAEPAERVAAAYRRIDAAERPEVWIALTDERVAVDQALAVQARLRAGETLPLAGVTVAVKDNIDVAGLPTTAGCPDFAYIPSADATAVARLRAAGAIVIGKTNLDQFATGLVGTRSPYGAVRDARDPERIAGGSSAGSAVAVALGLTDLSLGTDTAGSGRVPAAFGGIVGVKPTRGLVSTDGVVPACRSFDCVSVFAGSVTAGERALETLAEPSRRRADAPLAAPPHPRIATFPPAALAELSPAYATAFAGTLRGLPDADLHEVDADPFLAAGELLYGGAFVAERYAAVGAFMESHPAALDPAVAEIVLGARSITAAAYVADRERLTCLQRVALKAFDGCDALLLPTVPLQPMIAEVAAAPLELNRRLGTYVSFANLLDLCALSLPAGTAGGGQFGVTLYAPAGHDRALADLGRRLFTGEPGAAECPQGAIPLLVLGAHLRGQPLNGQLTERGARFLGDVRTASDYRLYRLGTDPAKPGLVRAPGSVHPGGLAGELWALPPVGLATFLDELPAPMTLGSVALADGRSVTGFLCEPAALDGAEEITRFGGWRAYLQRR
jgi:allophanate hydrolase